MGFGVLGAILSGKATESDCRVGVCANPGSSSKAAPQIDAAQCDTAWEVERVDFIWTSLVGVAPSFGGGLRFYRSKE